MKDTKLFPLPKLVVDLTGILEAASLLPDDSPEEGDCNSFAEALREHMIGEQNEECDQD